MNYVERNTLLERVASGLPAVAQLERQILQLPEFHFREMPLYSDDSVADDMLQAAEIAVEALRTVPIETIAVVIADYLFRLRGAENYEGKDARDCERLLEHMSELAEASEFVGPPPLQADKWRGLRLVHGA